MAMVMIKVAKMVPAAKTTAIKGAGRARGARGKNEVQRTAA